ncbi:MAG: hemin uptake protein HemP [Burkholderiaceae bacterium]
MQPRLHAAAPLFSLAPSRATLSHPAKTSIAAANVALATSVESTDLLRGQKTVEIKHNGAVYRLQTTKLGKLILTK